MRRISADEVHARKVAELGLDPSAVDLTAAECIAAAIRRAAGFLCPCSALTLVRAVVEPLDGLVPDLATVRDTVDAILEAIVAHGDLLEYREVGGDDGANHGTLLYPAPPSFVLRQSGAALLLGITPDEPSPLPHELASRIEYTNHTRTLPAHVATDPRAELIESGLVELSAQSWLRSPAVAETPAQHVARLDRLLEDAVPSMSVPGLLILDPERRVTFYRGRWVEPRAQSGRFVARRSQAYGADLWCYVETRDGNPERLIDLPLAGSRWRGCDEAWHLQMAIDAQRGEPQRFRIRPGPEGTVVMKLFSPVPMWARRRWDAVGEPVSGSGCLFAYRLGQAELAEELRFAREALWLDEMTGSGQRP